MSYLELRRPRKSIIDHARTLLRRLTWYRGPRYIVRWEKLWRYGRTSTLTKGNAICDVGGDGWRRWVAEHDRLTWYDPATGCVTLKRETYRRKLRSGATAEYAYWRAYRWPMRRKKPVRVYVGCLEALDYDELAALMRELARRYDERRRYYLDERRRRAEKRRRAAKHRWYKRYRARNLERQNRLAG